MLVEVFLQAHREPLKEIVLDLDSTDIPLHGEQEERFFHGYYGHYCYLPLYIVCGEYVMCARLRPSNIDGAKGSVAEVDSIVVIVAWPQVRIILAIGILSGRVAELVRSPWSGLCRRLAQNPRLLRAIAAASAQAASQYQESGKRRGRSRSLSIKPKTVGHAPGG